MSDLEYYAKVGFLLECHMKTIKHLPVARRAFAYAEIKKLLTITSDKVKDFHSC